MSRSLRVLIAVFMFASVFAGAQEGTTRPAITGIARIRILVTSVPKSREFYDKILRLDPTESGCGADIADCLVVNERQQVQLMAAPSPVPSSLIAQVAFATPDVLQMRRYLISKGLKPDPISIDANHSEYFGLDDPEGHHLAFVHTPTFSVSGKDSGQTSGRLIHTGFIVRDRQAEDHFYLEILGFRPYWHGGMKDDETSWVSLQVPDGTDWVEYMLSIPSNADHHTIGVMNHIALGVVDIRAAKEQLLKNGWKGREEPKMGRDGKWQLNIFDPDDTRIEFMEFKPVEKPCCSDFTGPNPTP